MQHLSRISMGIGSRELFNICQATETCGSDQYFI